jgi:hypothetical protein
MSQTHYKHSNIDGTLNTSSTDRGQELMRLKKEYHNMVRKEISKIKKDEVNPNSIFEPQHSYNKSKSPDRVVHSANH